MWKEKRKSQAGKKGFRRKNMGTGTDRKEFFYGWYFRCQGKEGSVAVIPAVHLTPGHAFCSVQILTENGSLYREFPMTQFRISRKRGIMQIEKNRFGKKGIHMNFEAVLQEEGRSAGTEKQIVGKKGYRSAVFFALERLQSQSMILWDRLPGFRECSAGMRCTV